MNRDNDFPAQSQPTVRALINRLTARLETAIDLIKRGQPGVEDMIYSELRGISDKYPNKRATIAASEIVVENGAEKGELKIKDEEGNVVKSAFLSLAGKGTVSSDAVCFYPP